jgi:CRP/FNR family transcriptional regulator, cyclic AMP receptor protein
MKTPTGYDSAIDFVMNTTWGKGLTSEELERVCGDTRQRLVPQGTAVCRMGSPVEYWKGVMSGLVKMSVVSPEGRTWLRVHGLARVQCFV